jgi:hypothetical protein
MVAEMGRAGGEPVSEKHWTRSVAETKANSTDGIPTAVIDLCIVLYRIRESVKGSTASDLFRDITYTNSDYHIPANY